MCKKNSTRAPAAEEKDLAAPSPGLEVAEGMMRRGVTSRNSRSRARDESLAGRVGQHRDVNGTAAIRQVDSKGADVSGGQVEPFKKTTSFWRLARPRGVDGSRVLACDAAVSAHDDD